MGEPSPQPTVEQIDAAPQELLLYDGECDLCDRTINFILKHERGPRLKFAPLAGVTAAAIIRRHPDLREVDSIVLVMRAEGGERVLVRSDAAIRLAEHLTGGWRSLRWLKVIPARVRDFGYGVLARRRYRIFGRLKECRIPTPEVRDRFLP